MTRKELLGKHKKMCDKARDLMAVKNLDYGGQVDPFKNFRRHGLIGISVRISDKLARLDSFIEKGVLHVKDESVQDTLLDLLNYAVLFAAYIEDTKGD